MSNFLYNLKGWAQKVASDAQASPEEMPASHMMATSIAKIAQGEGLNSEQIQRLCEESNYAVYTARYRDDPTSVYDSPVVEKTAVHALMVDSGNSSEKAAGSPAGLTDAPSPFGPGGPAAGPVAMPIGPVDGCFGGMHGVTKHADYLTPPVPPRPAGYDSFAIQKMVGDTLYKQASHGTQVSGADGPAVRMEYPDILGT